MPTVVIFAAAAVKNGGDQFTDTVGYQTDTEETDDKSCDTKWIEQ